jgi:hypothetical protein
VKLPSSVGPYENTTHPAPWEWKIASHEVPQTTKAKFSEVVPIGNIHKKFEENGITSPQ